MVAPWSMWLEKSIIGASRWQLGALPSTASKVGILSVIVHYLCIAKSRNPIGTYCAYEPIASHREEAANTYSEHLL
jgi:hypothetical protein